MAQSRPLDLPNDLRQWIAAHMDDAPDLTHVEIRCATALPFDWLPGNRKQYIGITLWNRICLREPFELLGEDQHELLFHELVHVRQFAKNPILFPLRYLIGLATTGYWKLPAEIEARGIAADLRRKYFATAAPLKKPRSAGVPPADGGTPPPLFQRDATPS